MELEVLKATSAAETLACVLKRIWDLSSVKNLESPLVVTFKSISATWSALASFVTLISNQFKFHFKELRSGRLRFSYMFNVLARPCHGKILTVATSFLCGALIATNFQTYYYNI